MIDVLNKGYFDQHGKIYTSVIPCNVFGPFDNFRPDASHVIPGLMRRLYDLMKNGNYIFSFLKKIKSNVK